MWFGELEHPKIKTRIINEMFTSVMGEYVKVVYYKSIKRDLKKRLIFDCRCDERLKSKSEGSTRLVYTRCREEPFVYYESLKREVKTKPICECRCDERLKTKVEESTRLACTLFGVFLF